MKVYHVYECFYDEPWYPNADSERIYSTFEDAQDYGNTLVKQALDDGYEFNYEDADEGETPMFRGDECFKDFGSYDDDDLRIYIDELEVM